MPVTRDMLLAELKELQRLTAFEQAVATVRRTQAASTEVAQELAANAGKAGERLALLAQTIRGAGGTPDVVGPVLGKLGALVQTQVNQVQTLQGALLGDLALEHQLRERARYARTLAVTLGEMSALPVLDRLDAAHTETISWLERRLGEVARTGSSALKATPVQVAVGQVRKVVGAPFGYAVEGVNQLGALVGKLTRKAPAVVVKVQETAAPVVEQAGEVADKAAEVVVEVAETVQDKASEVASDVADTVESAADAVEDKADSAAEAVEDTAGSAAEAVEDTAGSAADAAEAVTHEVLEASGGDDVPDAKPPFAGYERLSGDLIMRHVNDTEDVDELRTLLAFEQAHKARKGVLKEVQDRLTDLSAHA